MIRTLKPASQHAGIVAARAMLARPKQESSADETRKDTVIKKQGHPIPIN